MEAIFYKISHSVGRCYNKKNILYQLIAFLATYILVVSGFDWWYFEKTHVAGMEGFLFSAVIAGMFVPIIFPLCLLLVGYIRKNFELKNTAWALGQSALLGYLISTLYKIFTGRSGPILSVPTTQGIVRTLSDGLVDISHGFKFGFYRGGAFQGWPSSHTTVAFATAFALVALYPGNSLKHRLIRYASIVYAFYIGIGVSTNIHWFSDFVAGAVLGTIIGLSVGKTFLERRKKYQ